MSEENPFLHADSVDQSLEPERRRAIRFECSRKNSWRLRTLATNYSGQGIVNDISARGISLIVQAALRPGMFLDVSLQDDDGESYSEPMMVRVRRVIPQDDGTWLVGCSFVKKLGKQALNDWL